MTAMRPKTSSGALRRARRAGALLGSLGAVILLSGCATGHPGPISASELAEAQVFPYYRVYWVGPSFAGHPLAAADGTKGYLASVGDSVYYGDCVKGKGIFGGGSCVLPLQITTVIYRLHSNATLGPQRDLVVRGVPAVVYDGGKSIELYTGRVAVDIFSDTFARALTAAQKLYPLNAPGSAAGNLPPPIFCPELSGPRAKALTQVMNHLPGRACQRASEVA
jgi:hypothetical protein